MITKNKTAVFTSCAANYIPKALVLANTLKAQNDSIDMHLLLVDEMPSSTIVDLSQFSSVVTPESFDIPDFERWIFGHKIVEACTALKPFMLLKLLDAGYEKVLYLDPDIAVFAPIDGLMNEFAAASILLTPHISHPEKNDKDIRYNELSALKHGIFNLGFVGVKNDTQGRSYANWWKERCYLACFDDIANGVFTDQKWNDLACIFFERLKILRDSVYNVATWNYSQRRLEISGQGAYSVDGAVMVFHHFTGYDSGAHSDVLRSFEQIMPAAKQLSIWYENEYKKYQTPALANLKWKYAYYSNGEIIAPHHRTLYRTQPDIKARFTMPFNTTVATISYNQWLKNEGLWTASIPCEVRPFKVFLTATEYELQQFVRRTRKLGEMSKKILLQIIKLIFQFTRMFVR